MDDDADASVHPGICDLAFTQPDLGLETSPTQALCASTPWSIAYEAANELGERIECLLLRGGSIRRGRMATDIAAPATGGVGAGSIPACFYANFVVAGDVEIGRGSHVSVAKAGDVILYDSSQLVTLSRGHTPYYENLSLAIFKHPSLNELENVLGNVLVLRRDDLLPPLSSSLAFLADNMSSLSRPEVAAMFTACVSLLPIAIAHSNRNQSKEVGNPKASALLSALLDFVNEHICNAELSPHVAALNVGISVRYMHKLFAGRKTTFQSYVASKRLELVRREMISPLCRTQAISTVAYRCGFNDLSTFNRSFKRRYGVTPRKFRADAGAARVGGPTRVLPVQAEESQGS